MNQKQLLALAKKHGTPLFVVDHDELRKNYALFRKHFPRVQIYYAVKVNSDPAIVETFYKLGGSFDVASTSWLMARSASWGEEPPVIRSASARNRWACSMYSSRSSIAGLFRWKNRGMFSAGGSAAGVLIL